MLPEMRAKRMPGEGSIYRRKSDGRWVAALSSGPRGGRVTSVRYARTKAAARILLDELKAGKPEPSTMLTGAFLERWVNEVRDIRPTTRHGYRAVIDTHLLPTIGHIRLAELNPGHVETLLSQLTGTMRPKSLRNVHAVLRRALVFAVRSGLVTRNVAAREFVDTPDVPVDEPRALTGAQVDRLLAVAARDRLHALFVVAVDTGLRQGEILGLAWEDIDGGTIHVRKELVYLRGAAPRTGRYDRAELKTPRSRRDVPLTQRAIDALAEHRERLIAAGFVPTSTGPVFVTPAGKPLSGSSVTHRFYDLLAEAGIERLPFKNLRTTFASRLAEREVAELTISTLMGHTRTHTTRKHYIAQAPEAAADAIARLA